MIQDIAPHTFENHYHPEAKIRPQDPVLVVRDEKVLCRILSEKEEMLDPEAFRADEQIHDGTGQKPASLQQKVMEFPSWAQVCGWTGWEEGSADGQGKTGTAEKPTYLFTIDQEHYFLIGGREETGGLFSNYAGTHDNALPGGCCGSGVLPEGYGFYSLSELREQEIGPKVREFAAMTGMHLAHWYRNNRFCGRCGSPTVKDTKERALCCPKCGNKIYPRIVPAVIVGILNPRTSQILLTKYRVGYSHYALVAGFTEIGETLEGTVRREVMEETGLKVKNIRYYKSQPWGIVDDLLAGFYCEVDGDDTIRMDRGELKVAEWVSPEDVELQPQDFSLTNEMMYRFKVNSQAVMADLN